VLLFSDPESVPYLEGPEVTVEKGHGRIERREIRTNRELKEYLPFPGMEQVGEVKKRVRCVKSGQQKETTHYFVTSLTPEKADPSRLLRVFRGHWGIENRAFHVTDDSFGEDRHVLTSHAAAAAMSLLRQAAINLLRGVSALWSADEPLTARAQSVCARPLAALSAVPGGL
jgi:predicted transposase YbfD/YdcC